MKVKAEKVRLLKLGDRKIRLVKALKFKNNLLLSDNSAYYRGVSPKDSFKLFVINRLKSGSGKIRIDELYKAYTEFCNAYSLPILPVGKFAEETEKYLEVEGEFVHGVELEDRAVRIEKDSDVYLFETGRLRRKTIPVYLAVDGIPKTLTFDELQGYALNGSGELVSFDDETLAGVVSESVMMGATLGTQKLFWDIKMLLIVVLVLLFIVLYMGFQEQILLDKVAKTLEKMI